MPEKQPVNRAEWHEAQTLEDWIINQFEARKTDSHEFKAIVTYYGRERIAKIYEKWKKKE